MGANAFPNFDVWMERADAGFRVRVAAAPWGEAGPRNFVAPFSPEELTALFSKFGRTAPNAALDARNASDVARDFGSRLFDTVFADDIKSFYRTCAQLASNQNSGLRIRLRLKDAPELADVPWELLHDGQDFLALSSQRALVRYLELPQTINPLTVTPPLRALVIFSSPRDYDALDTAREWKRLNDALADVVSTGFFEIELLAQPTLAALQQQLRQNEYHILHFSGHGEFDASDNAQSALVFQDETGRGQRAGALEIARVVRDHSAMRLVVLNACEGARASTRDAFAGVAQTLMQNGLPAAIAMQFSFTDQAAQIFAQTLYGALADQYAVDAALGETRKALANLPNSLEWATPVLFTRADDGNLFACAAMDENALRALKRAALMRTANAALTQENFARALDYAQRAKQLDPTDAAAQQLLQRVQIERDLAQLYAEGKRLYDAGQLAQALEYLRRIQSQRLNYRDTDALVSLAERAAPRTIPAAAPRNDPLETHYAGVIKALIGGRLVPFLGVGVDLVGRPQGAAWSQGQYAPSSQELSEYLAENYHYPTDANAENLVGVSQYIAVMNSDDTLKSELHSIFDADYPPTRLHRFLATMTAQLRDKGYKIPCPIIISTTYDDILERTLRAANEPFDLVTYIADGDSRGNWWHRTPEGQDTLIDKPNQYANLKPDQRMVVVKIHGTVDRGDATRDSYVITEDHYIDYLTSSDISSLIPVKLKERLQLSSFLFMGYALRDWNLRVLLYRIWGSAPVRNKSWAIQPQPQMLDREIWQKRNVSLIDIVLEEYLDALETRVREYPRAGGMR